MATRWRQAWIDTESDLKAMMEKCKPGSKEKSIALEILKIMQKNKNRNTDNKTNGNKKTRTHKKKESFHEKVLKGLEWLGLG